MLDGLYPDEKVLLYKKLLDMDGIKIDGVLMPVSLIMQNDIFYGYVLNLTLQVEL